MTAHLLGTIALTGFTVAFLHAAIPTHWLPFVMTARAQRWSRGKTIGVTLLAGGGHVLFTTLFGIVIVWLGIELDKKIGETFPFIAGGALMCFGLYYLFQHFRGHGHSHFHFHQARQAERKFKPNVPLTNIGALKINKQIKISKPRSSDRAAIISLVALLTFSPCESFLPVYLSGISFGWAGFLLLSAVLAVGTMLSMVLLTLLASAGLGRIKVDALERFESLIMGLILFTLGIAVIFVERSY